MGTSDYKINKDKPRIVICSSKGLQAGDLAALLIHDYSIERVMTLPSLVHAMRHPARALIIFLDKSPICQLDILEMTTRINKWDIRIVIIGQVVDPGWKKNSKRIRFFAEVPDCRSLIEALGGLSSMEGEAS